MIHCTGRSGLLFFPFKQPTRRREFTMLAKQFRCSTRAVSTMPNSSLFFLLLLLLTSASSTQEVTRKKRALVFPKGTNFVVSKWPTSPTHVLLYLPHLVFADDVYPNQGDAVQIGAKLEPGPGIWHDVAHATRTRWLESEAAHTENDRVEATPQTRAVC